MPKSPYAYDPYEDGYDDEQAAEIAAWERGDRRFWDKDAQPDNEDDD